MPQLIKGCPNLFEGVSTVVDVGGGDGTTLSILVKAFPWIQGINYDLPHVVSNSSIPSSDRIEHVGGDMFDNIPKADAVFLKVYLIIMRNQSTYYFTILSGLWPKRFPPRS